MNAELASSEIEELYIVEDTIGSADLSQINQREIQKMAVMPLYLVGYYSHQESFRDLMLLQEEVDRCDTPRLYFR